MMHARITEAELAAFNAACPFQIMKFTLTYEGRLPPCTNKKPRAKEKWDIRRTFHPQLAELWQTDPVLGRLARHSKLPTQGGFFMIEQHHRFPEPEPAPEHITYIDICEPLDVGGKKFI